MAVASKLLVQWCTKLGLVISCSHFRADEASESTYSNGDARRILDYILVEKSLWYCVKDSKVIDKVDIDSDHRATALAIQLGAMRKQRPKQKRVKGAERWSIDERIYKEQLSKGLKEYRSDDSTIEDKVATLEEVLVKAAKAATITKPACGSQNASSNHDARIKEMIKERRSIQEDRTLSEKERRQKRKQIYKNIQKATRTNLKTKRKRAIDEILSDFRELKDIAGIAENSKRQLTTGMLDKQGEKCTDRASIAEVFAVFYEELYASRPSMLPGDTNSNSIHIPHFTLDELENVMKHMKKGKGKDRNGIIAEMIKDGNHDLQIALLNLFNDVLHPQAVPPEAWKNTSLW